MNPLDIAVVGAGYWGPNLVRNFVQCNATRVRYLVDLDLGRARAVAAKFPGVEATASYDQVLADPSVVAVAIATPVASHASLARRALEAGKHVLLEKPLASSVAEGEALVALARAQRRVLMVDHTFCYTGAVKKIRDVIRRGDLGDILYYDSVRVNLGLFSGDVSVIWDLAPHDLSILDVILPGGLRPSHVSADAIDPVGAGQHSIAHLNLFFTRPDGRPMIAHVHANWLSPVKVRTILIGGTKKMILWDDNDPAERLKIYDKGIEVNASDRAQLLVGYRHGEATIPILDGTEALAGMAAEFAASIREARAPYTDGEAGLRILRILEAADRSIARHGQRVALEPAVAATA